MKSIATTLIKHRKEAKSHITALEALAAQNFIDPNKSALKPRPELLHIDNNFLATVHAIRDMVDATRQGLPASMVNDAAQYLDMPRAHFIQVIDLGRSTIERRISRNERLSPMESDRLYRLSKITSRAIEVLEDEAAAKKWMQRENRSLGGVTPLSLLDTDAGVDRVLNVLGRIEHGIVA